MKTIFLILIIMNYCFSEEKQPEDIVKFDKLKKVLSNDGLEKRAKKKMAIKNSIKKKRAQKKVEQSLIPSSHEFDEIMTEYWLVKNASLLKWDYEKPDFGLKSFFKDFLEERGFYHINFKILITKNSNVTHFGLPAGNKSYIFIISYPFIRSLDLTKIEISLLLLENIKRLELGHFKKNVGYTKMSLLFGKPFESSHKKSIEQYQKKYSEIIYEKGFSFQQQFELTKSMDSLLKSNLALWNSYVKLIKKVDSLIKIDSLYANYTKIYPSPEIQINWLMPKKDKLNFINGRSGL